jgi:hypothetical protein
MGGCVSICGSEKNPAFTAQEPDGPSTPAGVDQPPEIAVTTSAPPRKASSRSSFRAAVPDPSTVAPTITKGEAARTSPEVGKFMACNAQFSTEMKATLEHLDDNAGDAVSLRRRHLEMAALLLATDAVCKRNGIELDPLKANTDITGILNAAAGIAQPQLEACKNLQFVKATEALRVLHLDMDATPHLRDIAPEHRFRLCIDPLRLAELQRIAPAHANFADNPLLGFVFDNEPGYLHGMAKAWQSAMSTVDEPVTSEEIKTLNALATGYDAAHSKPYATFTRAFAMQFGRSLSADGDTELRQCMDDCGQLSRRHDAHIDQTLRESPFGKDVQVVCFAKEDANHDVMVENYLSMFHKAIAPGLEQEALPPGKLAYASIDLVQKLERLHPFEDGNCRTFSIILNKLLVQNGLRMSVMDDPNKLDGFSRAEVFQLVRDGQARVDGWRGDPGNAKGHALDSSESDGLGLDALEGWMYPGTLPRLKSTRKAEDVVDHHEDLELSDEYMD